MRVIVGASVVFFTLIGTASAGTITAVGAVKALNNISQMQGVVGTGNFDEGPTTGAVPLNVYSAMGLTWQQGALTSILPGVTNTGSAFQPQYWTINNPFPLPIAGGGTHTGSAGQFAGLATFSVPITQVGLTASSNGEQYLTAWNKSGAMIGQIYWTPASDSAFIGIDTLGVPIAMVGYCNQDVWNGVPFGVGGATTLDDSWIWAAGTCNSNSQCDDGNPCTTDTCNPVGACVHTNNTASCSPANLCLVNGVCQGGTCTGGTPGVVCSALDNCHTVGVCNPMNGMCSNPVKVNGTACDDMNACTATDTCQAGVCTGMNPVMCAPPDQCHTGGTCDMTTGMCTSTAVPDGTTCDDGNACTQGDTCMAGVCTGGTAVTCTAMDACHDLGMCDTTTGMCSNPAKADGAACGNGNLCTHNTCMGGTCMAGTPVMCAALDACHQAGTCDNTTGICSNPAAPDGTTCPGGTCASGACVPTKGGTGGSAGVGGSTGTGASTGTGGTTNPDQSGGCHCGVPGSSTGGTPAAALLMILALRRRRRAARRSAR